MVRLAVRAGMLGGVLLLSACADDGGPGSAIDDLAPIETSLTEVTPTTTPTEASNPVPAAAAPSTSAVNPLPPMSAVASLGYPRDLLDRGRVNIEISRADDQELIVYEKRLISSFFTPAPAEERRTIVPPNGQVVALQTLFGEIADCESTSAVTAELAISYSYGDDATVHTTRVPLDDATTLDDVRRQKCTQRRVVERNEFELRPSAVEDETMRVELIVRRLDGADRLAFDAIKGTVLFGVEATTPAGSPERVLEPEEVGTSVPLTFIVNRCDPHAVGETTRKFGLDLYVGVDGTVAQRIDIPIDAILPQLNEMLDRCKARTNQ